MSNLKSDQKEQKLVVITGCVFNGIGDFMHMMAAAREIRGAFSNVRVILMPQFHQEEKTIFSFEDFEHVIWKGPNIEQTQELVFCRADLIIEIPYPTNKLQFTSHARKLVRFLEYGKRSEREVLGLKENQAGIFTFEKPKKSLWQNLKSDQLKILLTGLNKTTAKIWKKYASMHSLWFCYTHSSLHYGTIFINLAVLSAKKEDKIIDVIMAKPKEGEEELLDPIFLAECGIGMVKRVACQAGQIIEKVIIDKPGKTLRLIDPFPLPHDDFETLVCLSHDIVGCTGDQSFSEALFFGKIPFYELLYGKYDFWQGMLGYARTVLGENSLVYEYFLAIEHLATTSYPSEEMRACFDGGEVHSLIEENQAKLRRMTLRIYSMISSEEFLQQLDILRSEIKQNKNFNKVLLGRVHASTLN